MNLIKKTFLGILLGLLVSAAIAAAYVVPIVTTEIDPNLGKRQCPGGKDWDLPGSSCHDGIIYDNFSIISYEPTPKRIKKRH